MYETNKKLLQYSDVVFILALMCSFSLEFSPQVFREKQMQVPPSHCWLKEEKIPAFGLPAFSQYHFFASVSAKCYRFNSLVGPRVKN